MVDFIESPQVSTGTTSGTGTGSDIPWGAVAGLGAMNLVSMLLARRRARKTKKAQKKLQAMRGSQIREQAGEASRRAASQAAYSGAAGSSTIQERQRRISGLARQRLLEMQKRRKIGKLQQPSQFEQFMSSGAGMFV